jgi:hypothetical protein
MRRGRNPQLALLMTMRNLAFFSLNAFRVRERVQSSSLINRTEAGMRGDGIVSALWAAARRLATTRRCIPSISMVLLAGFGNSAAIAQDPRGPVSPSPGFEAQLIKVDAVQTANHRAAVAVTPDQTRFWIQIDRAGSLFSSADRENGGSFIPQRILNIFDLPGEVVVVTQGVNSRCGIRYGISSLIGAGGTSLFIGRCGQTYDFHPQGSSLLATPTGTGNSEVIQYAHASTSVLTPHAETSPGIAKERQEQIKARRT